MQAFADVEIKERSDANPLTVQIRGPMTVETVTAIATRLSTLPDEQSIQIDLRDVTRVDTAGGWLLCDLNKRSQRDGRQVHLVNASPDAQAIIETVRLATPDQTVPEAKGHWLKARLETVGRSTLLGLGYFLELTVLAFCLVPMSGQH